MAEGAGAWGCTRFTSAFRHTTLGDLKMKKNWKEKAKELEGKWNQKVCIKVPSDSICLVEVSVIISVV